ncbi:hypothetical protein DPMN_164057 [Dreissena polymorpha]|uniref:Uncharacterized protein n=1 Tax=Dreissena polymorpha TaxID=45954 RepID=A0A9D4IS03_DREPO|nr:hypothetical protein DPMN_164057 [Dreissena polymorpha]
MLATNVLQEQNSLRLKVVRVHAFPRRQTARGGIQTADVNHETAQRAASKRQLSARSLPDAVCKRRGPRACAVCEK